MTYFPRLKYLKSMDLELGRNVRRLTDRLLKVEALPHELEVIGRGH